MDQYEAGRKQLAERDEAEVAERRNAWLRARSRWQDAQAAEKTAHRAFLNASGRLEQVYGAFNADGSQWLP